uniref:Copg-like protein n=1 Tax=Sulfolobus neozealandicus TaxID=299422 RepID=Q5NE04_9CREN|nr:Copg-like protein [Sulfolobus neozealandicus]
MCRMLLISTRLSKLLKLHDSALSITLRVSLSVLRILLRVILSKARGANNG